MEITRREHDRSMELTITGRLDSYWADHLDNGLTEIVREGHHHLRLDLSGVAFLSSAGIAVLMKFHKRLAAIKGALVVSHASTTVRTVLDMTRLSKLLIDETPASAPETFVGRIVVRGSLVLEVFDLARSARLKCRTNGDEGLLEAGNGARGTTITCPTSGFAIGIGAFGANDEECRNRHGEFLAVGGAAAYLPGDGTEAPDYLVASDAEAPTLRTLRSIICDGPFAYQLRFDVKAPSVAITLDELAAAAIDLVGGAAGIVIAAEAGGLVGASLRRSPAVEAAGDFFAFPDVRARLTFTAERAFARTLALVAGVAQPAGGPVPAHNLRPLDTAAERLGHFHAAAFPYHPFKKGRIDLKETVRALFDSGELLGLLHLLHDDREIAGVGQSEFTRGACWIAPIDHDNSNGRSA